MSETVSDDSKDQAEWDNRYEVKMVGLMAIGFGLVGLDRFILYPLFPAIADDLGLGYEALGILSGVVAITWGLSSVLTGNLADRVGRKIVLVVSAIAFSSVVALTGLATGLIVLVIIRALLGFAEGGFVPASITTTIESSKPSRMGFNFGLQQMAAPLVGLGLGPIIAVSLLSLLPGWQWVFVAIALPGYVVAYLIWRVMKDDRPSPAARTQAVEAEAPPADEEAPSLLEPFKYRNVVFGSIALSGMIAALHINSTFVPNFLTDYIGLPMAQMGFVMSFLGLGGFVGMVAIPTLSDRYGKKIVMMAALAVSFLVTVCLLLVGPGTPPPLIALFYFTYAAGLSGTISVLIGPTIGTSVPPHMAAAAVGLAGGIAEIIGGGFGPAFAGMIAEANGIQYVPVVVTFACGIGVGTVAFGIREPKSKAPAPMAHH